MIAESGFIDDDNGSFSTSVKVAERTSAWLKITGRHPDEIKFVVQVGIEYDDVSGICPR